MENRKTFTYNGVNSADYGLYISGDSVYNAPSRVYDMVDIAGRNGQLAIDQGRFENIEVTYPAFIYAESQTEFAQRLRDIRAWLMSPVGYQRLEDTYHPDEFRMAIYMSGLEADPTHYNEAGEFELTFNCKPQRFLKSGEEEITIGEWGETQTVSGSIATFEAESNTGIKSLVVDINPVQSGSGDPSPTNVRPISGWSGVNVSHSGADQTNPTVYSIPFKDSEDNPITVYGGEIDVVSGKLVIDRAMADLGSLNWIRVASGTATQRFQTDYFLDKAVRPSSNNVVADIVCENVKTVTATQVGSDANADYSVGMYANGYMDIRYSSVTTASDFKTAMNGVKLVYPIATPIEIQLTPTEVQTILGVNNIWADSGEVSVEYGEDPNILVNPTPFEALPLFEVVGTGSLTVGNTTIGITGDSTQDIFIDSDIMEAYEDDNGAIISRNDRISLSGMHFPILGTETGITYTGLTSVTVTPRWWTI